MFLTLKKILIRLPPSYNCPPYPVTALYPTPKKKKKKTHETTPIAKNRKHLQRCAAAGRPRTWNLRPGDLFLAGNSVGVCCPCPCAWQVASRTYMLYVCDGVQSRVSILRPFFVPFVKCVVFSIDTLGLCQSEDCLFENKSGGIRLVAAFAYVRLRYQNEKLGYFLLFWRNVAKTLYTGCLKDGGRYTVRLNEFVQKEAQLVLKTTNLLPKPKQTFGFELS